MSLFNFARSRKDAPAIPRGYRAYAIGDIHGRLDLLDLLLADIERDIAARSRCRTVLVFLGDLIDRGPQSREVVERLRTYRRPRVKAVFLAGNHEEVLLRILSGEHGILDSWLTFGGAECLKSYGIDPLAIRSMSEARGIETIRKSFPPAHLKFLNGFADTLRLGNYLFVHAGIRPGLDLALQNQSDLRWIRSAFLDHEADHGFVVVHGHTIARDVVERSNRIGIDTGAYRTGVLTALGLEGSDRWYLATHGETVAESAEKAAALI